MKKIIESLSLTMAKPFNSFLFTFFILNIFISFQAYAVPYDYSYTLGCKPKPEAPQYNGGIVVNPELNEELKGWTAAGNAKLASAQSPDGNKYAVVSNILANLSDAISHTLNLEKDKLYTVSAWLQVSQGEAPIQAKLVTSGGNRTAGWITAKNGCWTMLKGGFEVNVTEPADLRFESNITGVDFWVDSISVQPFTQQEWASHQDQSIEQVRKTKVKFEAVDQKGKAVANAAVSIKQREPHFPFGNAINKMIIENKAYQKWFLDKGFKYAVFENELKWELTEPQRGVEDYTIPDKMLEFCKANNIKVRGHNILWDDPKFQAEWTKSLAGEELKAAALERVNSVVTRYKGQFIHWDVINENMHHDRYSSLTTNGVQVFKLLYDVDPSPVPFLNEFNVIEDCSIFGKAMPWQFLQKINQIRDGGYTGPLGIGLEGHFNTYAPTYPYIRASIDMLAATGLPIWVTEFDVNSKNPLLLVYIEPILRELYAHPAVNGILSWASLGPNMSCYMMCLTDNDYKNLPAGDSFDRFMSQFIRVADTNGKTDANGVFEASLFYGQYEASLTVPNGAPVTQTFNLLPHGDATAVQFKVNSVTNPEL